MPSPRTATSRILVAIALAAGLAACSGGGEEAVANGGVSLRNLTETATAAPARGNYQIEGTLIDTPSDERGRYYLLRHRTRPIANTVIAVIREQHENRIAYARVEVDCAQRLFHVLGVGSRRSFAEAGVARDGPLRPFEGLPLREDISRGICSAHGTPLAAA